MSTRPHSRPHSLHTETLRSLAEVSRVADYLDLLATRFKHEKDGRASLQNFMFIGEALSPVLPRLNKHVHRARKVKVAALKLHQQAHPDRPVRLGVGPIGRLP